MRIKESQAGIAVLYDESCLVQKHIFLSSLKAIISLSNFHCSDVVKSLSELVSMRSNNMSVSLYRNSDRCFRSES
jgi:hypothetical protein